MKKEIKVKTHTNDLMFTIPSNFLCPLTRRLYHFPVRTPDGLIFEREALKEHLTFSSCNPVTGNPLSPAVQLTDAKDLRVFIDKYLIKHGLAGTFRLRDLRKILLLFYSDSGDDEDEDEEGEGEEEEEQYGEGDNEDEDYLDEDEDEEIVLDDDLVFGENGKIRRKKSKFEKILSLVSESCLCCESQENVVLRGNLLGSNDCIRILDKVESFGPHDRNMFHYYSIYSRDSRDFSSLVRSVMKKYNATKREIAEIVTKSLDSKEKSPLEYAILYGPADQFEKLKEYLKFLEDVVGKDSLEEYFCETRKGMEDLRKRRRMKCRKFTENLKYWMREKSESLVMRKCKKQIEMAEKHVYNYCCSVFCKNGNLQMIKMLFSLGIVKPNDRHETLFHIELAGGYCNCELLEYMLDWSRKYNLDVSESVNDALSCCAANGLSKPAQILVEKGGANVNSICKNFRRYCSFPLSAASFYCHIEFVRWLLSDKNAKVNLNYLGLTAINAACHSETVSYELIKLLLDNNAKVNPDLNMVCDSPLMVCAKRRKEKVIGIMKLLVKYGGELNAQNIHFGNTAGHYGAMYCNYEACEFLVKAGADFMIKNKNNETVFDLIRCKIVRNRLYEIYYMKRKERLLL